MEPLISIVVPVYNVESYLDACMESIVNQSYTRLEILVVDDGSTDSSGVKCDRWAERDERVSVIHQPNGGLSAARNSALDIMTGELVMMVDSDDVVHPDAVKVLLGVMNQYHADIAVGGYVPFYEGQPDWSQLTDGETHCFNQDQAIKAILYQKGLTHSAWGRLYRASLFDTIRYPIGEYYEDFAIIYPLLLKCSQVVKTDCPLYGYRQRKNSILDKFSPKRAAVIDTGERLEQHMLSNDKENLDALRSRLLSAYFNILILSNQDKSTDHKQLQDRCWAGIKRLRWRCLLDHRVRLKNKVGIIASYFGRWFLCSVLGSHYHPRP
ncbi:MAG: glycosyltransferase [Muribaculaceae bacterium]|nr:glycosyltransferase [Muribaculaceae bacterium]